jgi:uncharacterized membrane protein YedE/YeeE
VTAVAALAAVAVGGAFGYGAQHGAFCMNSGFRAALDGETTKLKAFGLAVAVQLVLLPIVFRAGLGHPPVLPLPLVAALAGGLLFGASMRWAGGCAAGLWYKLGAGDVGSLVAVLGMAFGAIASESGPLSPVRLALQRALPNAASWTPDLRVSIVAGLALLAVLSRLAPGRAGVWDWRRTGIWVGLTAALAWPASMLAGRNFGLAVVPGTADLMSVAAGARPASWDLWLVLGVAAGGWLATRRHEARAPSAPKPVALVQRLIGGAGLGIGASIATGCTVGQGLTGLAVLAPSSFVITTAIFAGSALTTVIARRYETHASRPAIAAESLG